MAFDVAYLLGDGHEQKTVPRSEPTGQSEPALSAQPRVEDDGSIAVDCQAGTRSISRSWDETKEYRDEGGWGPTIYGQTAALDGMVSALALVIGGAICHANDHTLVCPDELAAVPFALSFGYGLLRYGSAQPPTLVGKELSPAVTSLGPLEGARAIACPSNLTLEVGNRLIVPVASDGRIAPADAAQIADLFAQTADADVAGSLAGEDLQLTPALLTAAWGSAGQQGLTIPWRELCAVLRADSNDAGGPGARAVCAQAATPPASNASASGDGTPSP